MQRFRWLRKMKNVNSTLKDYACARRMRYKEYEIIKMNGSTTSITTLDRITGLTKIRFTWFKFDFDREMDWNWFSQNGSKFGHSWSSATTTMTTMSTHIGTNTVYFNNFKYDDHEVFAEKCCLANKNKIRIGFVSVGHVNVTDSRCH